MELLFPHKIDRYRLIAKLVWLERATYFDSKHDQVGIGQKALAARADMSQGTVSNIQNLEKSIDSPKRRVSRREMLQVLSWGLGLPQQKVDAILWLFDGKTLTEDEIRRFLRGYLPKASPESYGPKALRWIVLEWLRESFRYGTELIERGAHRAKPVKSIVTGDLKANLVAVRELRQMESQPGQRMLLMRYPSFLAFPSQAYPNDEVTRATVSQFRLLNEERVQNLAAYGERSIHHRGSIENYIGIGPHHLSKETRKEQIRRWIEFLEDPKYPYYEMRLAETLPAMELNVKTAAPTMMGVMVNEEPIWVPTGWKLQWLMVFDETVALGVYLDFERQWDDIPNQYNAKSKVISFLKYVLNTNE